MSGSRALAIVCVAGAVTFSGAGPAVAAPSTTPEPSAAPAPSGGVRQTSACGYSDAPAGTDFSQAPPAQQYLNFERAWQFTRGAGQRVAVIDTGVSPSARLPTLVGGGDFVANTDGLDDCDGHGTIVAGIIAARQDPTRRTAFAGVAPAAQLISIRQSSAHFSKPGSGGSTAGDVGTLARAIRSAVDQHATVINISEAACGQPPLNDGALGDAVKYAADHNVVVVVAAGNQSSAEGSEANCRGQNPGLDPLHPDSRGWGHVNYEVSPARFTDDVLTVGSVDEHGNPSTFSEWGPWMGVAAPGEDIVSLGSHGGLANQIYSDGRWSGIQGTSFAAPYVSGIAALVRARYPHLDARQVIERIEDTAHSPANGWDPRVGYGIVDPVAAVTAELPPGWTQNAPPASKPIAAPAPAPVPDTTPRNAALIGLGICATLLVLGSLISLPLPRARHSR